MYIIDRRREHSEEKIRIKELIQKYQVLSEDYEDTLNYYKPGTPEYENVKQSLGVYREFLSELKRLKI